MAASKQEALHVVTREVMQAFYDKLPLTPVPETLCALQRAMTSLLQNLSEDQARSKVVDPEAPLRLDDNFWRNRQYCEEVAQALTKIALVSKDDNLRDYCSQLSDTLLEAEACVRHVQNSNNLQVRAAVRRYLPQDMRSALLERGRLAKERGYEQQVQNLMKKGGDLKAKYDLLLKQQKETREDLSKFCAGRGLLKVFVRFVGGVPQHLLDFVQNMNSPNGLLEEQRIRYGPELYKVTEMGQTLSSWSTLWLTCVQASAGQPSTSSADTGSQPRPTTALFTENMAMMQEAVHLYCSELSRISGFIGSVFEKSPFFGQQASSSAPLHKEHSEPAGTHAEPQSPTAAAVPAPAHAPVSVPVSPDSKVETISRSPADATAALADKAVQQDLQRKPPKKLANLVM